jgi:hypothetical protein
MAGGRSTINSVLKIGESKDKLTKVCRIKSYPQLGGEAEQLESTDMEDIMQTFVMGVQQTGSMAFTYNYEKETYDAVKALARKDMYYQLEFGENGVDGIFSWQGQHSTYINEGAVNGIREATISVVPSTEITEVEAES